MPVFEYIIAVGSNIDPKNNIERGFAAVRQKIDQSAKIAPLLKTKAQGDSSQPDYINTAFYLHSHLSPTALKKELLAIEAMLKRVRTADKNAARTIDLDICVCDGSILDDDYHRYDFVRASVDFFQCCLAAQPRESDSI